MIIWFPWMLHHSCTINRENPLEHSCKWIIVTKLRFRIISDEVSFFLLFSWYRKSVSMVRSFTLPASGIDSSFLCHGCSWAWLRCRIKCGAFASLFTFCLYSIRHPFCCCSLWFYMHNDIFHLVAACSHYFHHWIWAALKV